MNWKHFYTFLWLRWRLTLDHVRRQSGFARASAALDVAVMQLRFPTCPG